MTVRGYQDMSEYGGQPEGHKTQPAMSKGRAPTHLEGCPLSAPDSRLSAVSFFCVDFLDEKPDSMGRRVFWLTWKTDYTPSIPRPHIRGQIFHARPEKCIPGFKEAT
jgi:hypothetical protein